MRRVLQKLALILLVSVSANHSFASPGPTITSLNPNSGPVGTVVAIAGTSFGATQGTSTVTFNGTTATPTNWNDTSIVVPVPNGATSGNVVVAVGGVASNGVYFTVITVAPLLVSMTVDPANLSVAAGNTALYTATATYSDGSTQDVTAFASWSSTAPNIAVIDGTGMATGIANGQTAIQAMLGGISGSAILTVTAGQLDAVITPTYRPVSAPLVDSPNQKAIAVGADGFARFLTGDKSPSSQTIMTKLYMSADLILTARLFTRLLSPPAFSIPIRWRSARTALRALPTPTTIHTQLVINLRFILSSVRTTTAQAPSTRGSMTAATMASLG